jgi:hypothetical protein
MPTVATNVYSTLLGGVMRKLAGLVIICTLVTCVLSDKREFLVDTSVAVGGKTYRCVTVLDENLKPAGAAWTPVE